LAYRISIYYPALKGILEMTTPSKIKAAKFRLYTNSLVHLSEHITPASTYI